MRSRRSPSFVSIVASVCIPTAAIAVLGFTVTAKASETGTAAPAVVPVAVQPVVVDSPTAPAPAPRLVVTPRGGAGLAVFATPGDVPPSQVLPPVDELGSPLVLLAVGREGDWYRVLLPTRPNGSTGWVQAAAVDAAAPVHRVEVSFATHRLRVVRIVDGAVLLSSVVGFGAPQSPTPAGEFYVRDQFPTGSANHPYGPFAFGLSGHSDVYQQFGTGDGRIAIHGTNQPWTIGADLSNGCVHVPNDVVLALVDLLPLGTPVVIS